ncbi:DUF5683 domain-containing protein [Prevotella sp. 10(H)]|uniref:DUF5683 domain-containing protein n=1 Tax=Prevotella sp. 10(H) TaxID=1158294 RepID=UPI0004A75758|nr:DUF5683 domain-containing protein [Prevotella sp. 10(H)]
MSRGFLICFWCILGGILSFSYAQEPLTQDSIPQWEDKRTPVDTVKPLFDVKDVVLADSVILIDKPVFKPDSKKAVIYSAIFPGLGQFYNRKYWKLPIVYGGALGITYAITWNGRVYNDYNQAFRDLVTGSGTSYNNYLPSGMTVDDYGRDRLQDALRRKKDFYRRNRDLAIIAAIGVYALCMIDAYVDAQLYDFDMSPDLSMRVAPVFWPPTSYSKASIGLQCSINF